MWVQLASWQTPSTCTGLTGIYQLLLRRSPDLMNIRSRTPFELTFHLFLEKRCFSPVPLCHQLHCTLFGYQREKLDRQEGITLRESDRYYPFVRYFYDNGKK